MKKYFFLFAVFVSAFGFACGELDLGANGIFALDTASGEKIYFKRRAAGLSFDRLWITTNNEPCKLEDITRDVIFREQSPILYHRFTDGELHIYSHEVRDEKERLIGATRILFHRLTNQDDIENTYTKKGLERIEVKFDDSIKCSEFR